MASPSFATPGVRRLTRRVAVAGVTLAVICLMPVDSLEAASVLVTRSSEQQPTAGSGVLAWTEAPRAHPTHLAAYVRRTGGPRLRMNPRGTLGSTGGGAIEGTRVVFQQRRRLNGPGDLKIFDLTTQTVSDPPPGVNTRLHEMAASVSGKWLLFTRVSPTTDEVILFDLVTGQARRLAAAEHDARAASGSVAGNFASWNKCPRPTRCNAYVFDIAAGTTRRVPNPRRRSQYAVSVTPAGDVYFGESRNINCGARLALWRYTPSGLRRKLVSFPRRRDVSTTAPVLNPDGTTTLFYDSVRFRRRCRPFTSDILKLTAAP